MACNTPAGNYRWWLLLALADVSCCHGLPGPGFVPPCILLVSLGPSALKDHISRASRCFGLFCTGRRTTQGCSGLGSAMLLWVCCWHNRFSMSMSITWVFTWVFVARGADCPAHLLKCYCHYHHHHHNHRRRHSMPCDQCHNKSMP